MCGINGIIPLGSNVEAADSLHRQLQAMNQAIAHRGPDGEGEYVHQGVALGHRRLSILDLSELGTQPMYSQDRSLVLVFNGEIYNYVELKAELTKLGRVFHTHCDTEVLLHAYEAWGPQCVERFIGMWAFAIWDTKSRTLFASRDRFGVKPFYFAQTATRFVFSSEIKGIGEAMPLHAANLGKVYEYLAYGYRTNDGETFFEGVSELLPAHNLFIENGTVRMVRYWQLPPQVKTPVSEVELRERLVDLVEDAVRLRFRSDVPVALLQSGGLDSSIICRIVDDSIEAGLLASPSITAYTAVFPGFEWDESETVRDLISSCHHVQLKEITTNATNLPDQLPEFVRGMGEPLFNTTAFMHYLIMQAIRKDGAKVVINGQGADEAFAGYGHLIAGYRLLDVLLSSPRQIWSQANALRASLPCGYGYLLAQCGKAALGRRRASHMRAAWKEGTFDVLKPAFRHEHDPRLTDNPARFSHDNLDQHLRRQIEFYGFNQIMHYEDQSSMLNSVEIRSPFVDHRVMEFAFSLPDQLKFDQGVTKRILRESFSARLPQRVLSQPKIGFNTPFNQWMQDPSFKAWIVDLSRSTSFRQRSIWSADKLQQRFERPEAHPGFPFWRFINLELWARAYGITNL